MKNVNMSCARCGRWMWEIDSIGGGQSVSGRIKCQECKAETFFQCSTSGLQLSYRVPQFDAWLQKQIERGRVGLTTRNDTIIVSGN